MIEKEPRMEFKDIFAMLFFFVGFLLLLVALHIIVINTTGNNNTVMYGVFLIALNIFRALLTLAGVLIIIHFLRWLAWAASTPAWLKAKQRKGLK